ncbi:MAG: hypothetical protein JRJ19_16080 [Deltaproteobacteria bacterium]|nr:hypothetical protein [Deltaproteobacteria bacterium]
MKKRILKMSVVLAVAAAMLFVLIGWGIERKATVTSEPLSCFSKGEIAICFDGQPQGDVICEKLDDTIVLCTSTQ